MNNAQKERIEALMKKEHIDSQVELLKKILHMLGENDFYLKAQQKRANFNKMIIGERNFLEEYIAPLEKILNTTYYYIKNGGKDNIEFIPKGIRYAAYIDDVNYYKILESNLKDFLICKYDEFDKTLLDYIIEQNSINGLRYLIENSYIHFHYLTKKIFEENIANNHLEKVLEMLIEIDDFDLFDKFIQPWNYYFVINCYSENNFQKILTKNLLIKLGNSHNILDNLLTTKEIPLISLDKHYAGSIESGLFCSPIIEILLSYAIKTSNNALAKKILNYGINHNNKVIEYFKVNIDEDANYIINNNGIIIAYEKIYSSLVVYKIDTLPTVGRDVCSLIDKLNYTINEFNAISKPLLGTFSNDVRFINDSVVKKSSNNEIEYKALKLFKNNNIDFVPSLIKQEDGFDYFTYLKGYTINNVIAMHKDTTKELLSLVKKLNEISKKELNGKVYVHGDLSSANVVFGKDNKIVGIIDWDSCHIGEEYEDVIYILWTWLNVGDPNKNDELTYALIKECLLSYSNDKKFKENFADKMIEVMENRLKSTLKDSNDYRRIFKWVKTSEIWVELYRDRISKEIG